MSKHVACEGVQVPATALLAAPVHYVRMEAPGVFRLLPRRA